MQGEWHEPAVAVVASDAWEYPLPRSATALLCGRCRWEPLTSNRTVFSVGTILVAWLLGACGTVHVPPDPPDAGAPTDSMSPPPADAGPPDAGPPPELQATRARYPWNGFRAPAPAARSGPFPARFAWDPAPAATHYELQLDDGCAIESYEECDFASPDLAVTTEQHDAQVMVPEELIGEMPRGRRFFWRVRSCDDAECTEWTTPRYLYLGRALDDFNGDGYPDLPLVFDRSTPAESELDRRVQVWWGGPDGLAAERVQRLEYEGTDFYCDHLVPLGDLDGDGYDDMLVVARQDAGDGMFGPSLGGLFFRGSAEGLVLAGRLTDPSPEGQPAGDWSVPPAPVGDLDGDGHDDIVHRWAGLVIFGSDAGLGASVAIPELGSFFLRRGPRPTDFDADGFLDLVWLSETDLVLSWRPGGRGRAPGILRTRILWEGPRGVENPFGADNVALTASHDADGDGHGDLVVLADSGLYLLSGRRRFPDVYDARIPMVSELRAAEGTIHSGDPDGDGYPNLAVPRWKYFLDGSTQRYVTVFRGRAATEPPIQTECEARSHTPDRRTRVSELRDYNSDGFDDHLWLVRGATDYYLLVFAGSRAGLSWGPTAVYGTLPLGDAWRIRLPEWDPQ